MQILKFSFCVCSSYNTEKWQNCHFITTGSILILTVKSRAVYRSTIQFLTIFGVLLTETCYQPRCATIPSYSNQSRIPKNYDQIYHEQECSIKSFHSILWWKLQKKDTSYGKWGCSMYILHTIWYSKIEMHLVSQNFAFS